MKMLFKKSAFAVALSLLAGPFLSADAPFEVVVDPSAPRTPISPYVYGVNQNVDDVRFPARRLSGNRSTGYNWENNASNAGNDWMHSSDGYATGSLSAALQNKPGSATTEWHKTSVATGAYSLVGLQMAGYVAADKNGSVSPEQVAPSSRWVAVHNNKPGALALSPTTSDGAVYMDEYVNFLIQTFGSSATAGGVKGYSLDNEPALWPHTHPRVHPEPTRWLEVLDKGVALAKTVKRLDPKAETFGPVTYGFAAHYDLQEAPDGAAERAKGDYRWFLDYYLGEMRKSSSAAGQRLLDVLDVHNYSEHLSPDDDSVAGSTDFSRIATNKARLQAPRSLWDSTFVENSWVQKWYAGFLPYLTNFQRAIDTHYPGTKLAITEYCYGGEGHISGALAQVDALGIMGRTGVYMAHLWPLHEDTSYMTPAFNLYLDYNGAGAKFGDTSVAASTSNREAASAHAAIVGSDASRLHLVVVNKNYGDTAANRSSTVTIKIQGTTAYTRARVFAFDASSKSITERAPVAAIRGNEFNYSLSALTAAHFVLESDGTSNPTPTPTPTPNPTPTPTPAPGTTDTATYNFESNEQGWAPRWGGITSATLSATQVSSGSKALRLSLSVPGGETAAVGVNTPENVSGQTVTMRVWLPANMPAVALQPYVMTGGDWAWHATHVTALTRGAWNTVNLTVPNSTPVQQLGLQFLIEGPYSGEAYIDSVQVGNATPAPALSAPKITAQPVSTSIVVGDKAVFSVAATGNPAPTFQWHRDNAPIAGQTGSTLTLSNVQTTQAGKYHVRLTNSVGSLDSLAATLTVNAASAWIDTAIGGPVPGTWSTTGSNFVVSAASRDIWGTADQFRFVHRTLDGDGTITARLASLQNTDAWAKAGLMIRANLTPGSPHAFACGTPVNGSRLQFRTTQNGTSSDLRSAHGAPPVWLRLQREGTRVTMSSSVDGNTWTVQPRTLELPAGRLYVGLAVTSHTTSRTSTARFENVTLTTGASSQTPPAAPVSLSAVPADAQVTLTWPAVQGATRYLVKRSMTSGSGYAVVQDNLTTTSYLDTGRTNGTTYFYVVTAANAAGESAVSPQASATPNLPAVRPLAPMGLTATAGNAQVTLTWTGSLGATSYAVKRSTTQGSGYASVSTVSGNTFTDTSSANGTTYFYVVSARNSAGESPDSVSASATPRAPIILPPAPTGLTATAGNGQVALHWAASAGATSYVVKRSTTSGTAFSAVASNVTGTAHTDTGRTNGTTYYYVVTATNASGESAPSAQAVATPQAPTTPPTGSAQFSATPATIVKGATSTLVWKVDGATSLTISPDCCVGTVTGTSIIVAPLRTTTYRLTANTPAGEVVATTTVTVNAPTTALEAAPKINIRRDDRSAIVDLDYSTDPTDILWEIPNTGLAAAGFRVQWWPVDTPTSVASVVTPNRRVQLQPLVNGQAYKVRVERMNARGLVCSLPAEMTFDGGDGTRVAALRSSLTYLDDFNLPAGPADEKLWNHAYSYSADPRFKLFFVNDQYHVHTLVGTRTVSADSNEIGQAAQRFRKPMQLEAGTRRRIVFDMDGAVAPRSIWYLDLIPVKADVSGHVDFFDEGSVGLPAKGVRFRNEDQDFGVYLVGASGRISKVASVNMASLGLQLIPNVRRNFEIQINTSTVQVTVDGKAIINASFGANTVPPGAYDLLWSSLAYNIVKRNNRFFMVHWDNFGFDGPVLEPRTIHNYVTQIEGMDYQDAARGRNQFPTLTVKIPDDLRPTQANATAEAWLVFTYQIGNFDRFSLVQGDYVSVNGRSYPLPQPVNNATPLFNEPVDNLRPNTVRIKLGDITRAGTAPLITGDNTFKFFADRTGIENLHVEVMYPAGTAPSYTPPAAIHKFPMHHDIPHIGPPARIERIGSTRVDEAGNSTAFRATVSGITKVVVLAGGELHSYRAVEGLMDHPTPSAEIWSMGSTSGIHHVDLYMRRKGTTGRGERIASVKTDFDAPAPQVRMGFDIDTRRYSNGDYELFVVATNHHGVESYPSYFDAAFRFDPAKYSGGYHPLTITISN